MSSLWTPSGERPVGRQPQGTPPPANAGGAGSPGPVRPAGPAGARPDAYDDDLDAAQAEAQLSELRRQLADAPAAVVVANHCYGLFELAAVYLSQAPPRFDDAQLAIDALGGVIDTLGERLGEARASLSDALAQIRMAYVQLKSAEAARAGTAAAPEPAATNGATPDPESTEARAGVDRDAAAEMATGTEDGDAEGDDRDESAEPA